MAATSNGTVNEGSCLVLLTLPRSPEIELTRMNNAETAAALLGAGADVNARARNKFENTPLQVALLTSSREVARVLLALGADVNVRQSEGVTALHEAAQSGDLEIIHMLLAAGADPNAASEKFGTPRELALKSKHDEAARLLSK